LQLKGWRGSNESAVTDRRTQYFLRNVIRQSQNEADAGLADQVLFRGSVDPVLQLGLQLGIGASTGRLASMTRAEAAELVAARGGHFVTVVSPQAILTEEEFFDRLSLGERTEGVRRLYTAGELTDLLHVTRDRLRAWMRAGLVQPAKAEGDVVYFDFRQVSGAKTLAALAAAGASKDPLLRSLRLLRTWMPEVEQPLARLAASPGGELLVRLENGQLAEPSGQLVFDFEAENGAAPGTPVLSAEPATAAKWFDLGLRHEEAVRLLEAAQAYRRALDVGGPDAQTYFNLANVLYRLGDKEGARERLYLGGVWQDDAATWNNLGTVLEELGQWDQAHGAYLRALALDPGYADAHYDFADLLDTLGVTSEAVAYWRAYLQQDADSQWGRYARRRLSAMDEARQNAGNAAPERGDRTGMSGTAMPDLA
jgi:tetratricopeptide (TPR) repeat protein